MSYVLALVFKPLVLLALVFLAAAIKWAIWKFLPDGWAKYWLLRPITWRRGN